MHGDGNKLINNGESGQIIDSGFTAEAHTLGLFVLEPHPTSKLFLEFVAIFLFFMLAFNVFIRFGLLVFEHRRRHRLFQDRLLGFLFRQLANLFLYYREVLIRVLRIEFNDFETPELHSRMRLRQILLFLMVAALLAVRTVGLTAGRCHVQSLQLVPQTSAFWLEVQASLKLNFALLYLPSLKLLNANLFEKDGPSFLRRKVPRSQEQALLQELHCSRVLFEHGEGVGENGLEFDRFVIREGRRV